MNTDLSASTTGTEPQRNGAHTSEIDFSRLESVGRDLMHVPRRYAAAFALRCGRRVAPLILKANDPEVLEWLDAVDSALTQFERWARGESVSRFRLEQAQGNCRAACEAALANDPGCRAADGIAGTADVVTRTAPHSAAEMIDWTPDAVADAVDRSLPEADADDSALRSAQTDFSRLLTLLSPEGGRDDRPAPTDFFGPLWVNEEPEWSRKGWAKLRAFREQKEQPKYVTHPHPELFEREPEGIAPMSDEMKASLADWKWINDELDAGRLLEYSGKCIAVIDRQVVGVGESQLALMRETAERLGVPSCRVAVSYID